MLEQVIKKLLEDIVAPLIGEGRVRPIFGTGKPPFVVYIVTPVSGGVVTESQVEVKVIDRNFDRAIQIRDTISGRLDMSAQVPSIACEKLVLRSQLAGGGSLFNDGIQMWELSCIYIVNWVRRLE